MAKQQLHARALLLLIALGAFVTAVHWFTDSSNTIPDVHRTERPHDCVEQLVKRDGIHLGGRRLSQGLQDPVLRATFACVGITNKYYVEFGFNEPGYGMGGTGPNTYGLHVDGWKGLLLDGGQENGTINLHRHFLFYSNIGSIFRRYKVPQAPDYLSVDMDSHDWFVALGIFEAGYRPRAITFEFNLNFVHEAFIHQAISVFDPTYETKSLPPPNYAFRFQNCSWGASPAAIEFLARKFGYTRITVISNLDVLYLRDDLVPTHIVQRAATKAALSESYAHLRSDDLLAHAKQQDRRNLDNLVDVEVLMKTRSPSFARRAAYMQVKQSAGNGRCWKDASL